MPSLTTIVVVGAIAVVLYGLGRVVIASLKQGGAAEAERDEERRDRETARRQAEIMLENKDAEDVARDLDSGEF